MKLIKKIGAVLGVMVAALVFSQGCTSSTGSTSGGSGSISKILVSPAASSLQASQIDSTTGQVLAVSSTFITVIVRDNNGTLVPAGTPVNIACGAGFLGDNPDLTNPASASSITLTTNANGQVQVKYTAGFTAGTASISATSLGNSGSTTITIV